jgi:hypothetical protein
VENDIAKHPKTKKPSDADLKSNPLIGGINGARAAGGTPDELERAKGANTIKGDTGNDVNAQGSINKNDALSGAPRP